MAEKKIINVKPSGDMQFMYDDKLKGLLDQGDSTLKRASHVEPYIELSDAAKEWIHKNLGTLGGDQARRWWADMMPSGGGVLGPFDSRHAALEAERVWINDNVLTKPKGESCPTT